MDTCRWTPAQALGLFSLFAIASCAAVEQAGNESARSDAPVETPLAAPALASEKTEPPKRDAVPDFTMKTLDGKPWTLSEHKGKVVVLNFWATWCPPCRGETPDLVALSNKYKAQGVEVVGVSLDENPAKVVPGFVKEFGVPYAVVTPKGDEKVLSHAQGGIPTTLLIDKRGGIESATTGMVSPETMGEQIESLLREKA